MFFTPPAWTLCWVQVLSLAVVVVPVVCQGAEYVVGPGQALAEVGDVPWEALEPGDVVVIHARPEPYRAKWVICRRGTEDRPIVVRGVPDAEGKLPVIDGRDAVTRGQLNFWGEERGVIKIGGANRPADATPAHIVIEGLEIRSARTPFQFTGRNGETAYAKNAACIFIEKGEHITVRGCVLHDSGNGLFSSPGTKRVLVESCWIHGNGIEGSIYEHNNYTSSQGITFQFNRFGPLRAGCSGNNLKDRSAGLVVRYNWIEGGNRALDLVDGSPQSSTDEFDYRKTFVYGNVLIKRDEPGNNQVVHYGGDSNNLDRYRKGTLYFYSNTIVSQRPGTTVLFRCSSAEERVDCRNNIVYVTAAGRSLAVFGGEGTVELADNWFKEGWRESHSAGEGKVVQRGRMLTGAAPGFRDEAAEDYRLADGSPCLAAGGELPAAALPDHRPVRQYVPHRASAPRQAASPLDLGAFGKGP
jgi:hypothetical protein